MLEEQKHAICNCSEEFSRIYPWQNSLFSKIREWKPVKRTVGRIFPSSFSKFSEFAC